MAEVRLVNLTKRFGDLVAVNKVTLTVNDGEFVVLLGPSGCGKTTTLRCIAGLEVPDEGDVFIDGLRVNRLPPADRDIAFVFQNYALYPHLTVYDNIAFPLRAVRTPRDEVDRRVREVVRILHIEHLLHRKPHNLSSGEMQRVALGRAMVRRPKVFLMDEPLSNLDALLRVEMRAELKRLQTDLKATTVFVTHDQVEAMSMGDKIAVMNQGVIQQIGTPDEIYNRPANLFVASFVGSPAMNLVPCRLIEKDGKRWLTINHSAWELDAPEPVQAMAKQGEVNSQLVLGLRAEDMEVLTEPVSGAVPAEIYIVEPLGAETIVNVKVGEHIIKVRARPEFRAPIGANIWLRWNQAKVHVFDAETTKALC